jgi:hypothetical protein
VLFAKPAAHDARWLLNIHLDPEFVIAPVDVALAVSSNALVRPPRARRSVLRDVLLHGSVQQLELSPTRSIMVELQSASRKPSLRKGLSGMRDTNVMVRNRVVKVWNLHLGHMARRALILTDGAGASGMIF